MIDLENVKLQNLPYESGGVKIWTDNDKNGGLSIFASVNGTTSLFSFSKYGVKKAKEWVLQKIQN